MEMRPMLIHIYVYIQDFERLATLRLQYLGPANRIRKVTILDFLFLCERNVSKKKEQTSGFSAGRRQIFVDKAPHSMRTAPSSRKITHVEESRFSLVKDTSKSVVIPCERSVGVGNHPTSTVLEKA